MAKDERYRPIRDYGAVGDCHGAALVSSMGSVDWCSLGRFDADPAFCRILDADRGGCFEIRPSGAAESHRSYLPRTNVLETRFRTGIGEARLVDFMPVGRRPSASVHDYVSLSVPHWLVRKVEATEGEIELAVRYRPTLDFGRRPAKLERHGAQVRSMGPVLWDDGTLRLEGGEARGRLRMVPGKPLYFVVGMRELPDLSPELLEQLLAVTTCFWTEWSDYCRYQGEFADEVLRSALTLKLLTYAPTGALVAAPTTSLPEEIGGERNWDYRFCWLRDSCFTLYALAALGYGGEARQFDAFLRSCCAKSREGLQVMYGVGGETELDEASLDHLQGYRASRPVRTGNAAHQQRQIDVYGEILDWAWLHQSLGGRFDSGGRELLEELVDFVLRHWREPDQGLWEMRGPPKHHVHGKVMSWVALDRGIRLLGARPEWEEAREAIRKEILDRGIDDTGRHLVQAYGEPAVDAALLQVPFLGFPISRELFEATVGAIGDELGRGPYLKRYLTPDGLPGEEGSFLICSFWMVDALLWLGRLDEARRLFEDLLACANDVGLYSEEVATDGTFLGNFPQAFTHLAFIASAHQLELCREHGAAALRGTHADRAGLSVEATLGWRGIWAAFKHTGRTGRLFSSSRSVMPEEIVAGRRDNQGLGYGKDR